MEATHQSVDLQRDFQLTRHAWERMSGRGLSPGAVRLVLDYGRTARVRGAVIYAIGRKEVEFYRRDGVDLSSVEGVQVVSTSTGSIMTVYRNRDLRGLRPRTRRARHSHTRRTGIGGN